MVFVPSIVDRLLHRFGVGVRNLDYKKLRFAIFSLPRFLPIAYNPWECVPTTNIEKYTLKRVSSSLSAKQNVAPLHMCSTNMLPILRNVGKLHLSCRIRTWIDCENLYVSSFSKSLHECNVPKIYQQTTQNISSVTTRENEADLQLYYAFSLSFG